MYGTIYILTDFMYVINVFERNLRKIHEKMGALAQLDVHLGRCSSYEPILIFY